MSISSELVAWASLITGLVNRLVMAALILLIGFIVGRLAGKLLQRFLREIEISKLFRKASLTFSIEEIIGSSISFIVYFTAIILALDSIGISNMVVSIISSAIIVIILGSIFLSIADFVPNFFAGLVIYSRRPIRKGDVIKYRNIQGRIIQINLIETRVETLKKDIIFIPNSNLLREDVTKLTASQEGSRDSKSES